MSQVEGAVPQFLWAHPRAAGGVEKFSQKPSLSAGDALLALLSRQHPQAALASGMAPLG